MKLGELFPRLAYGELSGLFLGSMDPGEIDIDMQPKIAVAIDNALRTLYTRMAHKRDYVTIELSADRIRYDLVAEHARSDTSVENTADRFILDTEEEPFQDNVLLILSTKLIDNHTTPHQSNNRMLSVGGGTLLGTVVDDHRMAREPQHRPNTRIELLSFRELKAHNPRDGQKIQIQYQAGHPRIKLPVDLNQEVFVAPGLEEALRINVAAQMYSGMSGEASSAKAQELFTRFENALALAQDRDMTAETETEPEDYDRLRMRGFI